MRSDSSPPQSALFEEVGLPEAARAVLPLLGVFTEALRKRCTSEEFAIPLAELCDAGLVESDLESLLAAGLVEKRPAPTTPTPSSLGTRRGRRVAVTESSVIGLTPCGLAVVMPSLSVARKDATAVGNVEDKFPVWNAIERELWWKSQLVKQFKRHATNQILVLSAFQAQGWPSRIDNPLPRAAGVNAKARLRQTLNSLRRLQKPVILVFHADGTGLGIRWEAVP